MRGLHRLGYSERKACALVGFARSTYYGIKFHRPSDRDMHQLLLEDAIKEIHIRSRGTYGRLRIKAALEIEQGLIVSVKVIAKLMKRLEIHGLPGPRKFVRSHTNRRPAPTCSSAPSSPFNPMRSGSPTSPSTRRSKDGFSVVVCWTSSVARSSAGRSIDTATPTW